MFSLRPPRERSLAETPARAPIQITLTHIAIVAGACLALLLLLNATLWPVVHRMQVRAEHEALMRRTREVQQLLDDKAAAEYLTRQTK